MLVTVVDVIQVPLDRIQSSNLKYQPGFMNIFY